MSKNNGKRPHKNRRKTTKKTTMPVLVARPNGRGALLTGGTPGNAGGTGRPPSALRATMREYLDLEVLADVMAKYRAGSIKPLEVGEFLARHGLGGETHKIEIVSPQVRENLRHTIAIINEELPSKDAERVLERLDKVWSAAV